MKRNYKFDNESTKKLIYLKLSANFETKFKQAEGNPLKLKKVWELLAKEISEEVTGKEVKIKYNSLYSIYKAHLDESTKSGSGSVKWKYWDVFKEHSKLKQKDTFLVNVEEVGNKSLQTIENDKKPSQKKKRNDSRLAELQKIFLKKSIKLLDIQIRNEKKGNKLQKVNGKLKILGKKIKYLSSELKEHKKQLNK